MIEKLMKLENDLKEVGFTAKQAETLLNCMLSIQKECSLKAAFYEYFYKQELEKRD